MLGIAPSEIKKRKLTVGDKIFLARAYAEDKRLDKYAIASVLGEMFRGK